MNQGVILWINYSLTVTFLMEQIQHYSKMPGLWLIQKVE